MHVFTLLIYIYILINFINIGFKIVTCKGVISEVRCGFLLIYASTPDIAVFLLHTPALAPIKIGLTRCGIGAVLWFGLDSFGSDWTSPNINFNLKNPPLHQLKNLANYSIQM